MSGWPSVHTQYWLEALSNRGHEVHLLLPPYTASPEGVPANVKLHAFSWGRGLKGASLLMMAPELRSKLHKIAPDVFHVHSVFAVRDWRLFSLVAAMCTFHPLVLTAWGSDLLETPKTSRAIKLIIQLALRCADIITGDSQSLLDAAQQLGASKEKLHEIQFGVDTKLFTTDVDTAAMRETLNLGAGPIVYSPRAFMPIYNQLSIVDAIPAILRMYPDCHFIFKRRSDYHSAKYEDQVRQRIKELNIENAVRIIPEIPYENLPVLYALSDVVVSVPDLDGTPRSVLEAMACGAYPVVSDVAALHDWISDGDNGLFVRAIESGQIAAAVTHALSSGENLAAAKLKNRKIVETRASSDAWVAKMESLYDVVTK
jgi:glycosyltransferase involved in cell wall biosynthesis